MNIIYFYKSNCTLYKIHIFNNFYGYAYYLANIDMKSIMIFTWIMTFCIKFLLGDCGIST